MGIGGKFKNNEVFVPDVLIAARDERVREILKPLLASGGVTAGVLVILGTVGAIARYRQESCRMMMEGKALGYRPWC